MYGGIAILFERMEPNLNENKNKFFNVSALPNLFAELTYQSTSIKGIQLQLLFAKSAEIAT